MSPAEKNMLFPASDLPEVSRGKREVSVGTFVLPKGKYEGMSVQQVLTIDPPYLEWLIQQPELLTGYPPTVLALIRKGIAHSDTPVHNALQARFLDPAFCAAVALAASPLRGLDGFTRHFENAPRELRLAPGRWSAIFEYKDTDVFLLRNSFCVSREFTPDSPVSIEIRREGVAAVEIKPLLGDDYSVVMRKMNRSKTPVLLVGHYNGRGVDLPNLREMFRANGQSLVMLAEVEALLAERRQGSPLSREQVKAILDAEATLRHLEGIAATAAEKAEKKEVDAKNKAAQATEFPSAEWAKTAADFATKGAVRALEASQAAASAVVRAKANLARLETDPPAVS